MALEDVFQFSKDSIPLIADPRGGPPVQVAGPSLTKQQEAANFVDYMSAFARVFDLSKPSDLKDYNTVIDAISKGLALLSSEEREFVESKTNWLIFLRWQTIVKIPESASRARLTPVVNEWQALNKRLESEFKNVIQENTNAEPHQSTVTPVRVDSPANLSPELL